uniref:Hypothetical secreted protein 1134 n=1 Tax=Amblyomma variegatum TaxID=34610 RepID=F0J9S9_AMBVA|nr:TPA_inf: hypothetical secreted protein 1134 [Amblyomma variegatum]
MVTSSPGALSQLCAVSTHHATSCGFDITWSRSNAAFLPTWTGFSLKVRPDTAARQYQAQYVSFVLPESFKRIEGRWYYKETSSVRFSCS